MTQLARDEVFALPTAERLRLAEELLESVAQEQGQTELTPAKRAELERRIHEYTDHPERLRPLDQSTVFVSHTAAKRP